MDNKNILIEMYQNTSTATQSIAELLKKSEDPDFKELLEAQNQRYINIQSKIEEMAQEKNIELKDNNIFEKIRLWTGIQMNTITNDSTRHLAELMLIGTVMGTLTLYKNRVDYKTADKDALALLDEFEQVEEDNFKELKKYLRG